MVVGAGSSQKMWFGGADEESRAYLQDRLTSMSKLMFWSFAMLLAFMVIVYTAYPAFQPRLNWVIYAISATGVALLWITWHRLRTRPLSIRQLNAIDVFYLVGTGSIFGASGVLAYDLRPSAYICLIYACLLVLLRSTIVPSTGKRTAIVSVIACAPMTAGTIVLVDLHPQDVPGPAYVGGGMLACAMAIVLATIGSSMLYDLSAKVAKAKHLTVLGQYTLGKMIGSGGNGEVYHAHHALLRRPTAVKRMRRIDAQTLDRFEREVQQLSQLTHANWVSVFDYGHSPDGVFYYAMEYLDGIDLEKLVSRFGKQPAERVVPILIQVCGALQEAHKRDLTHRDIKPGNIIISERGDVPDVAKVVDFGLVQERTSRPERDVMGTPAYVAPEAWAIPPRISPAVDIYGLGAVAYFLLAGRRVFDGRTSQELFMKHIGDAPRPLSELTSVSAELEAIVMRCLAKKPEDRPATVAELARDLRALNLGTAWSAEIAQQWWEQFRSRNVEVDTSSPTETITVDVAHRTAKAA